MTLRDAMTYLFGIGGLLLVADSCAASPLGGRPLHDRGAGYEVTVLVEGAPAQTYRHDGGTFILGQLGARYTLRVANHTGRRIEAVVSIDGRDAIDGRPADFRGKRGYLVPAWGSVDIEGWRISHSQAAAFRFSNVPDSYAARTGSARDVGVIGVAVFPEQVVPPVYRPRPYHVPPIPYSYDDESGRSAPRAESAPAPSPPSSSAPSDGALLEGTPSGGRKGWSESKPQGPRSRPGLGTEYGEAVSSAIYEVEFVRANATRPATVLGIRYDDRAGLVAMGIPVDGPYYGCYSDGDLRRAADPFPAADRRFAAPPPGWHQACQWR